MGKAFLEPTRPVARGVRGVRSNPSFDGAEMLLLLTKPHLHTNRSWLRGGVFMVIVVLGFVYCCWYEQKKKILYCWDPQPKEVLSALTGKS